MKTLLLSGCIASLAISSLWAKEPTSQTLTTTGDLVSESVVAQGLTRPVGFAAILKEGKGAVVTDANKLLKSKHQILEAAGVARLQFFTQKIGENDVLLATMDIKPTADADKKWSSVQANDALKEVFAKLNTAVDKHPRAVANKANSPWVRTETICKLRPANAPKAKHNNHPYHAAVTGLKLKEEAQYRLLHNNVWPGVIDAIGNSGISRFDIFLIEFGEKPYLFYLFEHTGKDFAADMSNMGKSPVNLRWWKFTDACQQALPEAAAKKEMWLGMKQL